MDDKGVLAFENPATGERFGEVALLPTAEAQQAVCDMQATFLAWSSTPLRERVRILGKLQEVLIDAADEISLVLNQDTGKSRQDGLIELFMTVDLLHQYRKNAAEWLRPQRAPRGLYVFKSVKIERRPYGVALVISPWNYPFYLSMPPVLAALLAGNTVVLKPSEVTAATGVLMQRLFERVPELAPYVRVVHGDAETGASLIEARPDFIFLTGSVDTGKTVSAAAAQALIPVVCELGGKDPSIVLEDADIKAAARWTVWGAFYNTGQTCMGVERVYVVEPVYERFVKEVLKQTRKLKIGFTYDKKSPYFMGPITDARQIGVIDRHLADALEKGAKVLYQGKRSGMFIGPTVLVDVDHSMLVMQEETFGPVLPIVKVADEAEAIRLSNDSKYGLSASVWSRDKQRAERVVGQLQVGSALINDTIAQIAIPMLPFGGVKQSGYGRIHGKEGLLQFTQTHAYGVGNPPHPLDLATIMRKPGNYWLADAVLKMAFGVTPRQRVEPLAEGVQKLRQTDRRKLALGLGTFSLTGALAGWIVVKLQRKIKAIVT